MVSPFTFYCFVHCIHFYHLHNIESIFDLLSKESRNGWEMKFNELCIQPVISNIDSLLKDAQELIINDNRQGKRKGVHM